MPICKKCKEKFPNWALIEGKQRSLHKRSYCLSCSPYRSNRGQKIKSLNCRLGRQYKTCPLCCKNFPWSKNNVCSSCRQKHLRYIHKNKSLKILGGKCRDCGMDDFSCLTFHHLDPSIKEIEMSAAFGVKSWDDIEKEVKKCCILCYNCHMKEHFKIELLEKIIDYYKSQ